VAKQKPLREGVVGPFAVVAVGLAVAALVWFAFDAHRRELVDATALRDDTNRFQSYALEGRMLAGVSADGHAGGRFERAHAEQLAQSERSALEELAAARVAGGLGTSRGQVVDKARQLQTALTELKAAQLRPSDQMRLADRLGRLADDFEHLETQL
jgi:hypothetical protein